MMISMNVISTTRTKFQWRYQWCQRRNQDVIDGINDVNNQKEVSDHINDVNDDFKDDSDDDCHVNDDVSDVTGNINGVSDDAFDVRGYLLYIDDSVDNTSVKTTSKISVAMS